MFRNRSMVKSWAYGYRIEASNKYYWDLETNIDMLNNRNEVYIIILYCKYSFSVNMIFYIYLKLLPYTAQIFKSQVVNTEYKI